MNAETLNTSAYDQFEQGTLKLHELVRLGRESSAEANGLRDWLYGPWEQLTSEQRDFGNGLSADLYMLNSQDGEVLEAATDEERSAQRLGLEIKAAWDRRAWAQALMLLRKGPAFFPPSHIAFLRARAYGELRRPLVALAFIRHARALDATKPSYRVLEVEYLREAGLGREAVNLARRYIEDDKTPVKLGIYAAGVVFENTRALPDADGRETWGFLARVLRRLLDDAVAEDQSVMPAGYSILGACHDGLGQREDAAQSYRAALQLLRNAEDHGAYAALAAYVADRFESPTVNPHTGGSSSSNRQREAVDREMRFSITSAFFPQLTAA